MMTIMQLLIVSLGLSLSASHTRTADHPHKADSDCNSNSNACEAAQDAAAHRVLSCFFDHTAQVSHVDIGRNVLYSTSSL